LRKLAQLKKPFPARMSLVNELNWEKRLMQRSSTRRAGTPRGAHKLGLRSKTAFRAALHQFLTPQVFKQGHQAWQKAHHKCSWSLKAIMEVLLHMTWGQGDSQVERFQTARAYFISQHRHEKRPGESWEGFQQALRRLPIPVFRALAAGLREQLGNRWVDQLRIGAWLPMGCDGSRLECPRTQELEERLDQAGKTDSSPMVYVSALVLLPLGLPWSWCLDKGTGSEHKHLTRMLPALPEKSLLVADAGYVSYGLYRSIVNAGHAFLIRMSSRAYLLSEKNMPLPRFKEGWVYYWPQEAQQKGQPPIRARLLRLRGKTGDVWLLTNLDRKALSRRRASRLYRWRWRNEGMFRIYKRTLEKIKLQHRTAALIFREAEGSLLALQLMMTAAAQASEQDGTVHIGPRQMLLRIRGAMTSGIATLGPRQLQRYAELLEEIHNERLTRTSNKVRRPWPRRKKHTPPKPPKIRRLTTNQKHRMAKILRAA
jgi:hypothetical protein